MCDQTVVTVSSKYQVVIPKAVRSRLGIQPGDKLRFIEINGTLRLAKVIPLSEARGVLKGLPASFVRDEEDRCGCLDP
jgi:AbrB family looped-hinge helix DNA binding protein